MKKALLLILLIAFGMFAGYQWYIKPLLNIYVGFSAKTVCSCHYLQKRSIADILKDELSVAPFIGNSIDAENKVIRSSFLGVERLAKFRKGLGCTLLSEIKADQLPDIDLTRNIVGYAIPKEVNRFPKLAPVIRQAFEEPFEDKVVNTRAVIVIKDSVIIGEQYAEGYDKHTPLMGWSMTKSVTNALVGILVKQGKLNIQQSVKINDWYLKENDPRQAITLDHLLRMSSGLYFEEEYDKASTVNRMLWTKADAGKEAYAQELQYPVDSVWYYSSGTTNIISHIIRNQFSNEQDYLSFPYSALFDKLGMTSVTMETDANDTYVGSSLMYASARDWAKFGLLYLQNGKWNGERILTEDWVAYSSKRTPTLSPYGFYGAHFWMNALENPPANSDYPSKWEGVPADAYYAAGFEGQNVLIIPSKNMVIVRLGQTLDRTAWDIGKFSASVLEAISD